VDGEGGGGGYLRLGRVEMGRGAHLRGFGPLGDKHVVAAITDCHGLPQKIVEVVLEDRVAAIVQVRHQSPLPRGSQGAPPVTADSGTADPVAASLHGTPTLRLPLRCKDSGSSFRRVASFLHLSFLTGFELLIFQSRRLQSTVLKANSLRILESRFASGS
jgi:hypothetical protein